jgi:HK97 family phage prohead protease
MEKIKMDKKWDFKGWATRHNVKCGDGRTIKEGAFKENHNQTVPLVWNHNHTDADNVLGHALLEYRKEGVYTYGKFNETSQGKNAKELVRNGDITALSIYANKLKQEKGDVLHGNIREVSLVLAGANPGAYIETVLVHGEGKESEEAIIWNNADLELSHSEDDDNKDLENQEDQKDPEAKKDPEDPKDTEDKKDELNHSKEEEKKMEKTKEQLAAEEALKHAEKTVEEVFNTLNEEQKLAVYALIGAALEESDGGKEEMKQNLFDKETDVKEEDVLTHAEFQAALEDAKKGGSLRDAFLAHGIENIDTLFPEVQSLNRTPELISRDMEWVATVMAGVSKSPFSRVKSTAANITADEARAKGYVKGNQKVEEVIAALKRTTTPQTVYKFQKLDRDDVIDITDFDVVVFIKSEMRVMLNEELARAFLIGDGRSNDSDDKIDPLHIRPIYGDNAVYTVSRVLTPAANATAAQKAKAFIQDIVRSRKLYKGSGNPSLFTTEDQLVEMLLLEDTNGRVIYETIDKLKTALRVKDIITVPVMEGVNRVVADDQFDLLGILVNLTDYNVGADKGGQVSMFEDFDLNFNKHEYLIETRCSGALKKPYSAIVYESKGSVVQG